MDDFPSLIWMQSDFFPYFSLSQCLAQLYLWPYGLKDVHSLCRTLGCLLQNFLSFIFLISKGEVVTPAS